MEGTIMKLVSILLVALMTLFIAAMAVNAEEAAVKEEMEKGAAAVESAAGEAKETVVAAAETATAKAEEVKDEATAKAEEVKEDATAKAEEVKENATAAAEKATPGFESLFALTGLLGAALLFARRA